MVSRGSLTDREFGQAGRAANSLVFASPIQATVVLAGAAADVALPSVVIGEAHLPQGLAITRVTAAVAWRKQVDSSGAENAIDGAPQIQVRSDNPGTFRNAIPFSNNALGTAADAAEGGLLVLGSEDLSIEVTGPGSYEFQWAGAKVDADSLTLHDVQTYLVVEFV